MPEVTSEQINRSVQNTASVPSLQTHIPPHNNAKHMRTKGWIIFTTALKEF